MAFLSPGVFLEEVSNAPQVVTAVTTSTMAIVGWTSQGPVNSATLITSQNDFTRTFGAYDARSLVPISVSAFFQNGGTRMYMVRVVPSDATAATVNITSAVTGEAFGAAQPGSSPVTITQTLLHPAVTPSSVTLSWNAAGTPVSGESETFSPAFNGTLLGPFTCTLHTVPITNDTVTIHWTESTVTKSATVTGSSTIGGTNAANLTSVNLNRTTGVLVVTFAVGHAPDASSGTVDYTPVGLAKTATDNGSGVISASGVSGSINYTTGLCVVTFTGSSVVPYNGDVVKAAYTGVVWTINAANQGAWGNGLQVTLAGDPSFFVYGLPAADGGPANVGTWTKFNVTVSLLNSSNVYEVQETYEDVVFSPATDPMYFADINHSSALISIVDLGYLNVPASFYGVTTLAEVFASGNGSTKTFTGTLVNNATGIVKTSLEVHYTIGAAPFTATANASGTISGTNIDSTKTNTINWTTGAVTLNFSTAPDNSTNITVDYIANPVTSSVSYNLAGAVDGTISSINETTVSNFADLKANKQGIYALDAVDEVMQLILPDFSGVPSVYQDMIAYADSRGDIFCILTTPQGQSATQAVDFKNITLATKSKHAAMYWPWVVVQDPSSSVRQLTIPPVGAVAGIYARTDNNKNVSKAPAGTVDGALLGILGLEHNPSQGDRDTVYPARINPLINSSATGMAVWGARTMSALTDDTVFIQAVRLFEFVEKSLLHSTQNYIFETINGNLYASLKTQINSFLLTLFNDGYFAGSTPSQAFSVVCDSSNNPPAIAAQGQVIVDIGIAPTTPNEFLRLRLSALTLTA